MKKAGRKPTIFAYGFDAAGFAIPSGPFETDSCTIRFLGYSAQESLAEADAVILPSGIFERWETGQGYGASPRVECDKDHMALREKQIYQSFKKGGWIAFLL